MKKLVLIHGRGQEGKDPEELKWTWVRALQEGLAKNHLTLPLEYRDISLPYYGNRLDQLIYGPGEELAEVIERGKPDDKEELRFKLQLLEALRRRAKLSDDQLREASDEADIEKGPLNWSWVQSILRDLTHMFQA